MPGDPQRPRTVGDVVGQVRVTTAVALLGLVGLAVGSIGPWVTTVVGSASGTDGDGKITLAAAGVSAAALILGKGRVIGRAVAGVAAFVGLAVAGYDLVHIQHEAASATLFGRQIADAGWGVYVSLIGAAVALVALAWSEPQPVVRFGVSALAVCGAVGVLIAGGLQGGSSSAEAAASATTTQSTATSNTTTTTTTTTPDQTTTTEAVTTTATTTSPTATEPATTGTAPQSLPKDCSPGVTATQAISCELASNVFYEYHKAVQNGADTTALSAWSPATKQYYTASCSNGTSVTTCDISGTTDPNAQVQITQAALGSYTPQNASDYAATHDVGPNG